MADDDLPPPVQAYIAITRFWDAVIWLGLLAYAIAALVIGSPTGRVVGAVLLLLWTAVTAWRVRRRFAKPS